MCHIRISVEYIRIKNMDKYTKISEIESIIKKNTKWKEIFLQWIDLDDNIDIDLLKTNFRLMVKYKNLLKKDITIDYLKSLTATDKSIEFQLNKYLRQIIINKQKDQFINSLKTKKYRHLFSEETESLISTILDENISVNALKYQFFNKIARYNDENNLINDLEQFKIKNTNWNQYHYLNLIKSKKLNH